MCPFRKWKRSVRRKCFVWFNQENVEVILQWNNEENDVHRFVLFRESLETFGDETLFCWRRFYTKTTEIRTIHSTDGSFWSKNISFSPPIDSFRHFDSRKPMSLIQNWKPPFNYRSSVWRRIRVHRCTHHSVWSPKERWLKWVKTKEKNVSQRNVQWRLGQRQRTRYGHTSGKSGLGQICSGDQSSGKWWMY